MPLTESTDMKFWESGWTIKPLNVPILVVAPPAAHTDLIIILPLEEEEVDISAALLEDKDFVESIKRAREEMRRGEYLTHQEVFGD